MNEQIKLLRSKLYKALWERERVRRTPHAKLEDLIPFELRVEMAENALYQAEKEYEEELEKERLAARRAEFELLRGR